MTSSARARRGFTLFEVLAAVAILALLFTILAEAAIVGLRSEGIDRRRAEASLLADRELVALQSALDAGVEFENGLETKEEEPYRITVELAPEDVLTLLPPALQREVQEDGADLETLLVDDRGESRIRRLSILVEWDEAGEEPERVIRISHHLDTTDLAALLPPASEDDDDAGADDDDEIPATEGEVPTTVEQMERIIQQIQDSR